ncbi:hypothetical protein [Phaeobacter piscinae]|uniref:hypothetical protein n=1 Tax=Phaeobacter piscinae TaxID=1580596 RepID=UPI000BBEF548|nr:hypothetical protein [Phaeobacter piscinae]
MEKLILAAAAFVFVRLLVSAPSGGQIHALDHAKHATVWIACEVLMSWSSATGFAPLHTLWRLWPGLLRDAR